MNHFTSFELSKKLWENGCRLKEKHYWSKIKNDYYSFNKDSTRVSPYGKEDFNGDICEFYPAYDILWDICVEFSKEFFGEGFEMSLVNDYGLVIANHNLISEEILDMIKKGETIENIEKFIWKYCQFNQKNKKRSKTCEK